MKRVFISSAVVTVMAFAACGGGLSGDIEIASKAVCACVDSACADAKMEALNTLTMEVAKSAKTMTEGDAKAIAEANAKAALCQDARRRGVSP